MPSSYSSRLRLELQATGENQNTWGDKANAVFSRIDDAIAGIAVVSLGTSVSAPYTLSAVNGSYDEARAAALFINGQLVSSIPIRFPAVEKNYWIYNNTTGSPLRAGPTGGALVSLQSGWSKVITNGTTTWIAVEPLSPSTYLTDASAAIKYVALSATQSLTGANTFTSTVNLMGYVSASALNVATKVSTSALLATTISTTNLVAVSASTDSLAGTNAYFTSVSASAVHARVMYVNGSTVLTSSALPASSNLSLSTIGTGVSILGTLTGNNQTVYSVQLIRTVVNTGTSNNVVGDVSASVGIESNTLTIRLNITKRDDAIGGGVGVGL